MDCWGWGWGGGFQTNRRCVVPQELGQKWAWGALRGVGMAPWPWASGLMTSPHQAFLSPAQQPEDASAPQRGAGCGSLPPTSSPRGPSGVRLGHGESCGSHTCTDQQSPRRCSAIWLGLGGGRGRLQGLPMPGPLLLTWGCLWQAPDLPAPLLSPPPALALHPGFRGAPSYPPRHANHGCSVSRLSQLTRGPWPLLLRAP